MRRLVAALALLLTAGLFGGPVLAAKPQKAEPTWFVQIEQQTPVEQQTPGGATQPDESLWVVNPTECLWDTDDRLTARWVGRLNKGQTISLTVCVVGDWAEHFFWLSPGNGDTATAISATEGPTATTCLIGPGYDNDAANPALSPIPDSNGGVGHIHTITFTVTNIGKRPLNNFVALAEASTDYPDQVATKCPSLVRISGVPNWWVE